MPIWKYASYFDSPSKDVSNGKPKSAADDQKQVEPIQEELLQFKLQQVWKLVDLPNRKRAIGTKWIFKNKKGERRIMIRNKHGWLHQGSTNKELCTAFEKLMEDKFQISSMGELTFFLGLQCKKETVGCHTTSTYLSMNIVVVAVACGQLGDRMERAATTASSLEAEQDSSSGPKCQDTILGGVDAQIRVMACIHISRPWLRRILGTPSSYPGRYHSQSLSLQFAFLAAAIGADIAEAENASLRARIKTTEAIEKITRNRERQARVKIEQQLAAVQESQRQDREDFRKLKELVTSQFGRHS
ncbi:hypothetical protein Tco_0273591 [Tanacetum coccineum]